MESGKRIDIGFYEGDDSQQMRLELDAALADGKLIHSQGAAEKGLKYNYNEFGNEMMKKLVGQFGELEQVVLHPGNKNDSTCKPVSDNYILNQIASAMIEQGKYKIGVRVSDEVLKLGQ